MSAIIVSIDIETTGLDYKTNQIIEFGAVIDNWNNLQPYENLPKFQAFIKYPVYTCQPYAAWLNYQIFGKLSGALPLEPGEVIGTPGETFARFYTFLVEHNILANNRHLIHFTPAGKNFHSFDNLFLNEMTEWTSRFRPSRRAFDPAILYYDNAQDDVIPDTNLCMEEAGIDGESSHRSIEDAICVLKLLRLKILGSA